ncbi:tripartite tricarboxylate transporter substrate binding protein [Piscinibacter sp. XHJ-5]|uniref:Bug family tripartite tricarboxylate transporter substrate binding protein n=1 Tax=Piscinibacter sp. XHJ-5 TaxID=3037797 RepID=UPI002453597F|nr:tripartite tricarboxylate transporter substrate binding protein [Piscinibacter sp. XHJ-5]
MRKLLLPLTAAAALVHGPASAAWPERPIRIVVPYAPGGFTDVLARLVATRLAEKLAQPVVVENKPGASTMLGAEAVARSAPDGYTLLMATTSTLSTNPLMFRKLTYKVTDFTPVALTGLTPFVLVAHPSVLAQDAAGLLAYARANPGKLNFAMLGPGSSTHLVDEMLRSAAGVDIPDVPYKGSGPASSDLLAGHVQLNFDAVSTAIPRIRSGQLKGLGITSDTRSPLLPGVPTFKESGLPQMVAYSWYGLVAPAATPGPVVELLNRTVNEVLKMPEVRSQLEAHGAIAPTLDAQRFGGLIEEHTRTWERIVKPLNLQLD